MLLFVLNGFLYLAKNKAFKNGSEIDWISKSNKATTDEIILKQSSDIDTLFSIRIIKIK